MIIFLVVFVLILLTSYIMTFHEELDKDEITHFVIVIAVCIAAFVVSMLLDNVFA